MKLVKKKKRKKRRGYRGPGGYQGGATNQGGAGDNTADDRDPKNDGVNDVISGTLSDPREKKDFVTQKFTGRSNLFGGANRFGYTDLRPDGSLKPGYGGRVFGGLLSLITGIPFVGGAIGSMYDKGTGIFDQAKGFFRRGPNYNDMSEFNKLGLYLSLIHISEPTRPY